jgi:hypothetical protein
MKIFLVIITCFAFLCKCSQQKEAQHKILSDKEWKSVLDFALIFSKSTEGILFKDFCNEEMNEVLKYAYINGDSLLQYSVSDSIINILNTRYNKLITNRFDTISNLSFVIDTFNLKKNYIMFSEPFYINDTLLCFSMINKMQNDNTDQMVFFFKKEYDKFEVIEYYVLKTDKFFKLVPLPVNFEN